MVALSLSCGARSRDVAGDRRERLAKASDASVDAIPEPPVAQAPSAAKIERPRLLTKANTRALALDASNLYYGNGDDDGVYAIAKAGGDPRRIARRAPVSGALVLESDVLTWIASPGDAVLRASVSGPAPPVTLKDRGIFSDVAAVGNDTFLVEAMGTGGVLWRIGSATSRVANFEGPPRVLLVDKTHVFVVTPKAILRMQYPHGSWETVAVGTRFSFAQCDDGFVYAIDEIAKRSTLVRVPKLGGALDVVASEVREAPFELANGELLFFDAHKPQIRGVSVKGEGPRVICEDEGLAEISAIVADAKSIFVAQGSRASGAIVAIARH